MASFGRGEIIYLAEAGVKGHKRDWTSRYNPSGGIRRALAGCGAAFLFVFDLVGDELREGTKARLLQ